MVKRKMKKRQLPLENHEVSSESEKEDGKPAKLPKFNKNLSSNRRSTPYNNLSSTVNRASASNKRSSISRNEPSTSNALEPNKSFHSENEKSFEGSHIESGTPFESFSSFLLSHSFVEEETADDFLTVSQLAEKRSSYPNMTLQQVPVSLNKSSQDASKGVISEDTFGKAHFFGNKHHTQVVTLEHPYSLIVYGWVKLSVLAGTASVMGYIVKEREYVNIFSNQLAGYKRVLTKSSVHKRSTKSLHKSIRSILGEVKGMEEFLEKIGSSNVVIALEKCLLPPNLQFLELYFPYWVKTDKDLYNCQVTGANPSSVIEVDPDAEEVAKVLMEEIEKSEDDGLVPRLLMHGPKNSGKSSMLRYLINTVLNTHSAVYYLDTDPGQTEFTPPGVVSLTKVTHPILGPPFCNQKKPVKMIFTGSVTPATSPPMYLQSIRTLIEYFNENFPEEVLFVNTMGWIEGIGDVCFKSIKSILKPTMLVELLSPDTCPVLNIEQIEGSVIRIQIPKKLYINSQTPKIARNCALLSYFGKCQKYYMQPTYINAFRPVCVCWDDIAIYSMGKKISPNRLLEAVQCSIVALCHVDESLMLQSERDEFPKTLEDNPANDCLGFGLVRAADESKHLLYIVTPLSVDELGKVNALIKGDIMVPDEVYLNQPIMNTPLPYTDQPKTAPTFNRKSVKKRQFKSVKQTPIKAKNN